MKRSHAATWCLWVLSCASLMFVGELSAQVPELVNGGFEVIEVIEADPGISLGWGGDVGEFVVAENGITPFEGRQMFKYVYTGRDDEGVPVHGDTISGNLFQTFDLRPLQTEVDAGLVTATMSARVNRVLGNDQTDRQFRYGFFGTDTQSQLTFRADRLFRSDGDPVTWESLTSTNKVPNGTAFLTLSVVAGEDSFNNSEFPEFDGHYVDDVTLSIVIPEPSGLALFAFGIGLCAARRSTLMDS